MKKIPRNSVVQKKRRKIYSFFLFSLLHHMKTGQMYFYVCIFFFFFFLYLLKHLDSESCNRFKITSFERVPCQRPYHIEYTGSRPITEVKQC